MTDSARGDEPTQRFADGQSGESGKAGYPGYPDPAYAGQSQYGARPTEPLPAYPTYGYDPYPGNRYGAPPLPPAGAPEPPDDEPGTPPWLWVLAGIAVVTVVGLVIALVIVNSSQQETVVAPVPTLREPATTPPTTPLPSTPLPTTPRRPTSTPRTVVPPATTPSTPGGSTTPAQTEAVVYTISGEGRAINITYIAGGGVLQTEFNVLLPWTKQVDLTEPANRAASVTIINVGRQVTCSITVNGVQVQQRTGSGLTICSPVG